MIGGFLQAEARVGRETAKFFAVSESDLAAAGCCGSLSLVVVVHLFRTRTGSLYRYPSSNGQSPLPLGALPIFFTDTPPLSLDRRSFANAVHSIGPAAGTGLHLYAFSLGRTQRSHNRKGCQLCRLPNGSRALSAPSHSQLAATRRWSRASSGQARVRAQLSCWTATRSPVPLSAVPQTSSIASATRRAADRAAGLNPRDILLRHINHRSARRSGGFLLSEDLSPHGRCPRDQEPEGT